MKNIQKRENSVLFHNPTILLQSSKKKRLRRCFVNTHIGEKSIPFFLTVPCQTAVLIYLFMSMMGQ